MADSLQAPGAKVPLAKAEDGTPATPWFTFWSLVGKRLSGFAGVATVTTADATDLASVIALANALKAKQNEILNSQKQQ